MLKPWFAPQESTCLSPLAALMLWSRLEAQGNDYEDINVACKSTCKNIKGLTRRTLGL